MKVVQVCSCRAARPMLDLLEKASNLMKLGTEGCCHKGVWMVGGGASVGVQGVVFTWLIFVQDGFRQDYAFPYVFKTPLPLFCPVVTKGVSLQARNKIALFKKF